MDQQSNRFDSEMENDLTCIVTHDIFLEPVLLQPSGITVEREAADRLIREGLRCPETRDPITGYQKNISLMRLVNSYLDQNPSRKAEQYVNKNTHVELNTVTPQAPPNNTSVVTASMFTPTLTPAQNNHIKLPVLVTINPNEPLKETGSRGAKKRSCAMLLLGNNDASGKKEFLSVGVVVPFPVSRFIVGNTLYKLCDVATQDHYQELRQIFLKHANSILYFGDLANVTDSLNLISQELPNAVRKTFLINYVPQPDGRMEIELQNYNNEGELAQRFENNAPTITSNQLEGFRQTLLDVVGRQIETLQPQPQPQPQPSSCSCSCLIM